MNQKLKLILSWIGLIFLFLAIFNNTIIFFQHDLNYDLKNNPSYFFGCLTGAVLVYWLCILGVKRLLKNIRKNKKK